MKTKTISTIDEFVKIKNDYYDLVRNYEMTTPFGAYSWLLTWWRAYQKKYQVSIFCLYNNNDLIALIPMMFGKESFRKIRIKKASLLGGNWGILDVPIHNMVTGWEDYFVEWVHDKKINDWSLLQIGPVTSSSLFSKKLLLNLEEKNIKYVKEIKRNPYILLGKNWNEFLGEKSRNFKRAIKRKEKKAFENGVIKINRVRNPDLTKIENTIFEVSKKSWQGRNKNSIASTDEGRNFYKLLCRYKNEFDLDLSALYADEKCIAYLFGITKDKVFHAFDTGYDPDYTEYSPGFLLHISVLKVLSEEGFGEFNFGHENIYKQRFEPDERDYLYINLLQGRFIELYNKAIGQAKKVLDIKNNILRRSNANASFF